MTFRRFAVAAFLLLALCVAPSVAQAKRGLTTGFALDPALTDGSATANNVWIPRAVAAGAGMVRVGILWSQVAPKKPPPGFVASDPASPGYNWTQTDAAVRELADHGIKVVITISQAPFWAEGRGMPRPLRQPGRGSLRPHSLRRLQRLPPDVTTAATPTRTIPARFSRAFATGKAGTSQTSAHT